MRMSWGANILDFFYDESGLPYAMKYNGTAYYYITNLQGDVMRIVDASQNIVTNYDPYGKVLSATGTLAGVNPLRYRGYVYDQETGFYNVSGRYYDPLVSRWINADEQISGVGGDLGGNNLFAYCFNNPVNLIDPTGNWPSREQVVAAMKAVATVCGGDSCFRSGCVSRRSWYRCWHHCSKYRRNWHYGRCSNDRWNYCHLCCSSRNRSMCVKQCGGNSYRNKSYS